MNPYGEAGHCLCLSRWPPSAPALCSRHGLFLLTQLALMAYFFPKELFHKLHRVTYHLLSTAFVNLEMKKKMSLQIVQSTICDPGRKTGKKMRKCLRRALSLAFRLVSFLKQLPSIASNWGPDCCTDFLAGPSASRNVYNLIG